MAGREVVVISPPRSAWKHGIKTMPQDPLNVAPLGSVVNSSGKKDSTTWDIAVCIRAVHSLHVEFVLDPALRCVPLVASHGYD